MEEEEEAQRDAAYERAAMHALFGDDDGCDAILRGADGLGDDGPDEDGYSDGMVGWDD